MRFIGLALTSALVLSACGGGDTAVQDTTTTGAATPGAAGPAIGTAAAAPVTGQIHEVRMLGDAQGFRYDPAQLTVAPGDGVRFIMVSGAPHNVHFTNVPAEARAQLDANIPEKMGELNSKMMMQPNEDITISFANVPAGRYDFECTPHIAMDMRGTITVQ